MAGTGRKFRAVMMGSMMAGLLKQVNRDCSAVVSVGPKATPPETNELNHSLRAIG